MNERTTTPRSLRICFHLLAAWSVFWLLVWILNVLFYLVVGLDNLVGSPIAVLLGVVFVTAATATWYMSKMAQVKMQGKSTRVFLIAGVAFLVIAWIVTPRPQIMF